jgi:hypothetical protein
MQTHWIQEDVAKAETVTETGVLGSGNLVRVTVPKNPVSGSAFATFFAPAKETQYSRLNVMNGNFERFIKRSHAPELYKNF